MREIKKNWNIFFQNIRNERIKSGLSQSLFAEKLDIPLRTFQSIEGGHSKPNAHSLNKICNALKIEAHELFKDPNQPVVENTLTRVESILKDFKTVNGEMTVPILAKMQIQLDHMQNQVNEGLKRNIDLESLIKIKDEEIRKLKDKVQRLNKTIAENEITLSKVKTLKPIKEHIKDSPEFIEARDRLRTRLKMQKPLTNKEIEDFSSEYIELEIQKNKKEIG